jgi:hypothetical protein
MVLNQSGLQLMSQLTRQPRTITHLVKYDAELIDQEFPHWARRSNPLVRRQLGLYWKMVLPESGTLARLYMLQIGLILLSVVFPFIFRISAGVAVASILLLPIAFVAYFRVLLLVAHDTTIAVVTELRENTLSLLQITPLTLREILMSKAAAAVWRRAEELSMIIGTAFLLNMPVILLQYTSIVPVQQYPFESRFVIFAAFTVSLARLFLEPLMISAVGIVVAILMPFRVSGALWTILLTAVYFVLVNLPRLLTMPVNMRLLLEIALPILLPLCIIWGAFNLATRLLVRD